MPENIPMNTTPHADDLWTGIAGHFDSLTQVIAEFVDNAISNIVANKIPRKSIQIRIEELSAKLVQVTIEDQGTGINNFEPVMRVGDKTVKESPLNEHGFGLKHALASANPENDSWSIFTKTPADFEGGQFKTLSAPYKFDLEVEQIKGEPWPGNGNGSGTMVQFSTSREFFNTLQKGIRGKAKFKKCLDYLVEELGFTYCGVIESGTMTLAVMSNGSNYDEQVRAVKPLYVDYYAPKPGKIPMDLGGGTVQIEYTFGEITDAGHSKHYKKNMDTSGVEIRINGRVVMANMFTEVWGRETHPSYNHLLVQINIDSDNSGALPKTRTSKNGIRSGDPKLATLIEWIRLQMPDAPTKSSGAVKEYELVEQLAKYMGTFIPDPKHIETEFEVFKNRNSPVRADLYVANGTDLTLYEAKLKAADLQNLYQLMLYWDGAVDDGLKPTHGILIASSFSDGVNPIIKLLNQKVDSEGNNYNFSTTTWRKNHIEYPE